MKEYFSWFRLSHIVSLLILLSIILASSPIVSAQGLSPKSEEATSDKYRELASTGVMYQSWALAVRYRFEELPEEHLVTHDPIILRTITQLRGEKLRYFLDSIEAINQIQRKMFPPGSSKETQQVDAGTEKPMTLAEEKHLVNIVTESVFSKGTQSVDLTELREGEQAYVTKLQESLSAIVDGDGDALFSGEYLAYRTKAIQFVEDTGLNIFDPSPEVLARFQEYGDSKGGKK